MISVSELIENYNNCDNNKKFLSQHIVTEYINFENKVEECKEIINRTMYKESNGKKEFFISSTARHFLFDIRVISLYTDIDINNENILSLYNDLNKNRIISNIYSLIPTDEINEFKMIMEMCINDEIMNYRELVPFLERKMESYGEAINALEDAYMKSIDNNNS